MLKSTSFFFLKDSGYAWYRKKCHHNRKQKKSQKNLKKVIKAYHKKEKSIYLQYFENQMELKNESKLDFSIFEDIKPFSFHGIIKNIFSALGHKYECLN